jgi:hypothetical protein
MDQWTVKWTCQCTPDDGRVTTETYVGWVEQKYENKKVYSLVKKLKINVTNMLFERDIKFFSTQERSQDILQGVTHYLYTKWSDFLIINAGRNSNIAVI